MKHIVPAYWVAAVVAAVCLGGCAKPRPQTVEFPRPCGTTVTLSGAPGVHVRWEPAGPETEPGDLCRSVGPAVLDSVSAEPNSSGKVVPPELTEIAFAAWDGQLGRADLEHAWTELRKSTKQRHLVLLLQNAFRIGPEVPPAPASLDFAERVAPCPLGGQRRTVIEVATKNGLSVFYVPSSRNGGDSTPGTSEDRGAAILTDLPLENPIAIRLPRESQRNVALAASIAYSVAEKGQARRVEKLRVVSVRLDERSSLRPASLLPFGRPHQAIALGETLDTLDPPQNATASAVVVAATFDALWGRLDPGFRHLRKTFPGSSARERVSNGHVTHVFSRKITLRSEYPSSLKSLGTDEPPLITSKPSVNAEDKKGDR